ncbi:peptidase dimerization domain-containing protein, partial [Vibrio parahaemolyticus]
ATLISGGTKENALPPNAEAIVNCRILPDEPVALVEQRLLAWIADPGVTVTRINDLGVAEASPITGEVP